MPRAHSGQRLASVLQQGDPMYSKIIVGYDGSAQADDALALGKLLAGATGASLTAVAVSAIRPPCGAARDIHFQDLDAELTEKLEQAARSAGAGAETIASSSPAHGLHDYAEQAEADLVVLGSARHGKAGQILAGSVATSLLHGSPCSVAVAPHGYTRQTRRMASPGHRRIRRLGRGAHRLGRGHRPRPRQRCAGQGGCRRRALTGHHRKGRRCSHRAVRPQQERSTR